MTRRNQSTYTHWHVLLAGLESWAFSSKTQLPDHLFEALTNGVDVLEREILKDKP